jgi:hypothetical protein
LNCPGGIVRLPAKQIRNNMTKRLPILLAVALAALLFTGCVTQLDRTMAHFQTGESLVLVGQSPASLAFQPARTKLLAVRSTYRDGLPKTIYYEAGGDFVLTKSGGIQRTAHSRIPDFGTNILYGKEDFNHSQFPGYGNLPFFV